MRVKVIARFKNADFYDARIRSGFPRQKDLAEALDVAVCTVSNWENFRSCPRGIGVEGKRPDPILCKWDAELVDRLEELLNTPIEILFSDAYIQAVRMRMVRPVEKTFEFMELPDAYVESHFLLPSPEDIYDKKELKSLIPGLLQSLTEREAAVLTMMFGLEDGVEHTLEEVGREFKVTPERIRQIEAKALRKLKHPSRSRFLIKAGFVKRRESRWEEPSTNF